MKVVTSGAHYTTVTVDTAEAVKFSFPSTSLSVEAARGDITVALTDTAQAGDDETITVPDGESRMFIHHRMNIDTYYLTGSGTAKLYASNMSDVNPFKAGKRGGDAGGDNTHYKGTTTTPLENGSTTNPIVIDGESYTAVFGDVVVYGYTEFVFDGTAWSEFGRPFDTVPTEGSMNAVTSDGIYAVTPFTRGSSEKSAVLAGMGCSATTSGSVAIGSSTMAYGGYQAFACGNGTRAGNSNAFAAGYQSQASGFASSSFGSTTFSNQTAQMAVGILNNPLADDLFEVGNGTTDTGRSNIFEVSRSHANVNGDMQINGINIPTPYTTMPAITESMLGQIAMYVGATGGGFTQGCFYVASTDGAAEPTYSWVKIGGGRTETVLWENTGTTNPDTITLSEAYTNFDELVVVTATAGSVVTQNESTKYTSVMAIGGVYTMWYNSEATWGTYSATSSTVFTKANDGGAYHISKIIGIKY